MKQESVIVKHIQCPRCAERGNDNHKDNLGVYSDDHSFCFACGLHIPTPNSINKMQDKLNATHNSNPYPSTNTPDDYNEYFLSCSTRLPLVAQRWLWKYDITQQEQEDNYLYWDAESELLVFPIFADGIAVGYNARNFSGIGPKYITKGEVKKYPQYLVGKEGYKPFKNVSTIVYTEDFLSAIKIARQYMGIPLLGTKLHHEYIEPLIELDTKQENQYIIWLDFDKARESLKQAAYWRQYYPKVYSLFTRKDPKEYNDKEINAFVSDCIGCSSQ